MDEKLIDSKELAEHLRLALYSVRKKTNSGELPCIRIGTVIRYRLSDVMAKLEEQK